jgi:hypothetical protein
MQWPVVSNSLRIGLHKSTNGAAYTGWREGRRVNRKTKKSGSRSQGDATTSFLSICQARQGHGDVAVPLVSSPSSCCAATANWIPKALAHARGRQSHPGVLCSVKLFAYRKEVIIFISIHRAIILTAYALTGDRWPWLGARK